MSKTFDHAKKICNRCTLTFSKKTIQKTAEATGDFIGNKIADRVRKFSKNLKQNHSEKVTIEYDKEIPKEKYISLK